MPVTTRSRSIREARGPKDHKVETIRSATHLPRDNDSNDGVSNSAASTSASTARLRSSTVATTSATTTTTTLAENTSGQAAQRGNERIGHVASRSSLSSRPASSATPTSDNDGIDTGTLKPEADQSVSKDRAPSSSNGSSSHGVTTRSIRGVSRSVESNMTVTTLAGTKSFNSRMKNKVAGAASTATGQAEEGAKGPSSGQDHPRRSLLPQPSSIHTAPTQLTKKTPSGNLSGLKLQLATKTTPTTTSPGAAGTEKKKSKSTLASLSRLSAPSKKSETKNGLGLGRSMTLPSSNRALGQKPSSVRSDERSSRIGNDAKASSTSTSAIRQPETPKAAREATVKRLNSASSLKPRQQQGRGQSQSQSKLPTAPSTTPVARASSLRQPTTPRLVLSSRKASTQQQHHSAKPLHSRFELNGNTRKIPVSSKVITTASALKEASRSEPASQPQGALQTELLQLYLFYERAVEKRQQEEEEAEVTIRQQYQDVAQKYEAVRERELAEQRYINVTAIDALGGSDAGERGSIAEQVRSLSGAIQFVSGLTHPSSGKYTNCVREFEGWIRKVESLRVSRGRGRLPNLKIPCSRTCDVDKTPPAISPADETQSVSEHDIQYLFTEPLSQDWDTDVTGLRTDLARIANELEEIDMALELNLRKIARKYERGVNHRTSSPPSSALLRVVDGHRNLVISMIDELDMIKDIEADVMAVEKDWLRCEVDRLIAARDGHFAERPTDHMGIWRKNANPVSN